MTTGRIRTWVPVGTRTHSWHERCSLLRHSATPPQWLINEKYCLHSLFDVFLRAVRKNHAAGGAADSDVDSFAIRWFNLASHRGGGRKEREKNRQEAPREASHDLVPRVLGQ
ncbi:hypothetical protein AALO_G00227980 [Alosa alosa]|uniref:Uncharacterized protein n=1 Tax=Alosa alosa TaxID=278164 RepID=A0AAV6FZW3_9TELE|nr:hypothetical protein AALO_G00227980 [Alosa alosa]